MQPVGLKLFIFPPLPRSQADVEQPSSWDIRGRWDGGMVGRRHGKYSWNQASHSVGKLFSCCIHAKPPRALRGKRALSVSWHSAIPTEIAMARISSAGAAVSLGAFHGDNDLWFRQLFT